MRVTSANKQLRIIAVLACVLHMLFIHAYATTVTVLDGQISITDTANSNTVSNGTVTIKASGSLFSKKTNTVTITNESGSKANISFSYSASTYNSFTIAGATANASGSYSATLDAGATITIVLVSNSGFSNTTATLTLSDFSLVAVAADASATVTYDSAKGSVSLGGSAVASGGSATASDGTLAAVATPASGCTFVGWVDSDKNKLLSSDASATLNVPQNMNIRAVFVNSTSDTAWFMVDNAYLTDNLTTASGLGTNIVLINNGTLAGTHTIDSGDTLLIPFDSANTLYTTKPGYIVEANEGGTNWSKPAFYRTLTMAQGANITVNGAISLSAKHSAQFGYNGMPMGNVSHIAMQQGSSITLNSGATLYAYGYITGSGTVTANSGSTVYENYQLKDWRGGSQTTGMDNGVFPMSQYYFQNIEVPLTIHSGAREYGITTASITLVGDTTIAVDVFAPSGALFNITSGSLTKDYLESEDRILFTINGNLSISEYTLEFNALYKIKTAGSVFPIPSHIRMIANSGNITVSQDISLYPGCEITIGSGAAMNISEGYAMYIYDSDQWGNYCYYGGGNVKFVPLDYAPGRTCAIRTASSLKDVAFCVNGTLSGAVYTSEGGANVYSTGTGTVTQTASAKTSIHQIIMNIDGDNDQYDEITFVPAMLKNENGEYVSTTNTTYNHAHYGCTCTSDCAGGRWYAGEHTVTSTVTAPTCEEKGYTTHACACSHSYTDTEVAATGHNYSSTVTTAATCTTAGVRTYTCANDASHTYTEAIVATGHKDEDGNNVCDVCGEQLVYYSVTITWDELNYVFTPEYTWNTTDLCYEVSGGDWSTGNKVTIRNDSNVSVWYSISAEKKTDLGWDPEITLSSSGGEIEEGQTLTSTVTVGGTPYANGKMILGTTATEIGTITISLSKEEIP